MRDPLFSTDEAFGAMLQRNKNLNGDLPLSSMTIDECGIRCLICMPKDAIPLIVKLQSSLVLFQSLICSGINLLKLLKSDRKLNNSSGDLLMIALSL